MVIIENKSPLVSIIIPTFNRAWIIAETLDSVLTIGYKNWECIVVDDGSTDGTKEIVEKYCLKDPRFRFYNRPEKYKSGANGARNYGFDLSKGDYIQWFDSDDIMLDGFLKEKVDVFINNPELQSVSCRVTLFEGDRKILKKQFVWNNFEKTLYENFIIWYMPILTPCILFRKAFLVSIKEKWDESIKRSQEYEFISRILIKHPHNTYFIEKSLALIRRNNTDAKSTLFNTEKSFQMNEATYLVQKKIVDLVMEYNKLTPSLIVSFYRFHKESLSIAYKHSHHELVKNYKTLIEKYLIYKNDSFDLAKFRLGFFLMKIIPVDNLFLNYRHHSYIHVFNLHIAGNFKQVYKAFFIRGWLLKKLKIKWLKSS